MTNKLLIAIYDLLPKAIVKYMMNWKTREKIEVSKWLADQIEEHKDMLYQILIDNDLIRRTNDATAIHILRWVHNKIRYQYDKTQYRTTEYWATVDETLSSGKGDCEDGATLVYCLCRVAGIPKERIFLCAGDVEGGGHAWVRYLPEMYAVAVVYLDWCYWYDSNTIMKRKSYWDYYGNIELPSNSKYKSIWFMANDESGFKWR